MERSNVETAKWQGDQNKKAKKERGAATMHGESWHGWHEGTTLKSKTIRPSLKGTALLGALTHKDGSMIENSKQWQHPAPPAPPEKTKQNKTRQK